MVILGAAACDCCDCPNCYDCGCGSSKSRTPQKPWLSGHRPDSLSAMRKMLILLLVALLHRLDRALAASYFESLAVRQQLAVLNRKTPRP